MRIFAYVGEGPTLSGARDLAHIPCTIIDQGDSAHNVSGDSLLEGRVIGWLVLDNLRGRHAPCVFLLLLLLLSTGWLRLRGVRALRATILGFGDMKYGVVTQFEGQRCVFGAGLGRLGEQKIVKLGLEVVDGTADVISPLLLRAQQRFHLWRNSQKTRDPRREGNAVVVFWKVG